MTSPHAQNYGLRITIGRPDVTLADTSVVVPAGNDLHAIQTGHAIAAAIIGALLTLGFAAATPVSVVINQGAVMQDWNPHYLVVEADPEDPDDEDLFSYRVECGGVTDACTRYEDCAPDAAERKTLDDATEEKPVVHGKRHIMVDDVWCAETTACNVATHDGLGDDVAGRFPVGRHEIDWDFGDGTELFIVARGVDTEHENRVPCWT